MRRRWLTLAAAVVIIACVPSTAATGAQAAAPRCGPGEVRVALGLPISPATGEHGDLFVITDLSSRSCWLEGYPSVSLSNGEQRLPFVYLDGGGWYVTKRAPQRVTLAPGQHGYFLVAKYRCDGGILATATSIRVLLPTGTSPITLDVSDQHAAELDYCKRYPGDQPIDPGNRVNLSPIEAAPATVPQQ